MKALLYRIRHRHDEFDENLMKTNLFVDSVQTVFELLHKLHALVGPFVHGFFNTIPPLKIAVAASMTLLQFIAILINGKRASLENISKGVLALSLLVVLVIGFTMPMVAAAMFITAVAIEMVKESIRFMTAFKAYRHAYGAIKDSADESTSLKTQIKCRQSRRVTFDRGVEFVLAGISIVATILLFASPAPIIGLIMLLTVSAMMSVYGISMNFYRNHQKKQDQKLLDAENPEVAVPTKSEKTNRTSFTQHFRASAAAVLLLLSPTLLTAANPVSEKKEVKDLKGSAAYVRVFDMSDNREQEERLSEFKQSLSH